ncbi:MAG: RNA 2',3'-cyclic phosphodiesterase [Pseudomonadota bacterium]
MPRLFVGLELTPDIAFALSLKRGGLTGARWIDTEKFHITLRFIGDVCDRTADQVVGELDRIDREPFEISLGNLDTFASRKPHSLWASVQPNADLMSLQIDVERAVRRAGLEPDSRKFTPHVTLARLKGPTHEDVARYLTERGEFQSLPFKVDEFVLLSSRKGTGGGPYIVEERFALYEDDAHEAYFEDDYASLSSSF